MAKPIFLLSDLFKVIGPGGTTFTVHQDLLAEGSKVLAKAVNGPMREGTTKVIKIEAVDDDIDDHTVMKFLEFMYTGYYAAPDPVIMHGSSTTQNLVNLPAEGVPASTTGSPDGEGNGLTNHVSNLPTYSSVEARSPTTSNSSEASSRSQSSDLCASTADGPSQITMTTGETCKEVTSVFMCHARLYKLADRYDCEELMWLCTHQLNSTFESRVLCAESSGSIIDLIRYIWLHTVDTGERFDSMRSTILDGLSWHSGELCRREWFLDLLNEIDSFSSDLVRAMAPKMERHLGGR